MNRALPPRSVWSGIRVPTESWWVSFRNDDGDSMWAAGSLSDFMSTEVLPWCRENIGEQLCGSVWQDVLGRNISFGSKEDAMLCYLRFA